MYRYFLTLLEYRFLKRADALISIGESAVDWIRSAYTLEIPCFAIPNCKEQKLTIQKRSKNTSTPLRFYYHGIVDAGRGLEKAIEAIKDIENVVLNIRGLKNAYIETLKASIADRGLESKVFFLDPVVPSEIVKAAAQDGDIGLAIMGENASIGIRISLTNKFIEYLAAGLPVVTSDLMAEQSRIIDKYQAGFVVGDDFQEAFLQIAGILQNDPDQYREMSAGAKKASDEIFDWPKYKVLLSRIVSEPLETLPSQSSSETRATELMHAKEECAAWQRAAMYIMESRNDAFENFFALQRNHADLQNEYQRLESRFNEVGSPCGGSTEKHKPLSVLRHARRCLRRIFKK